MYHSFGTVFIFSILRFSAAQLKLVILPHGGNHVVKENDDLNLTCKVSYSGGKPPSFEISWILPIKQSNSANRVSHYERHNEVSITVHKLQERDKGHYMCEAKDSRGGMWHQKVFIAVDTGKEKDAHQFFDCGDAISIPYHYVCDGYQDCPGGEDESFQQCGAVACEGKFLCDGRCIPKKYCCDPSVDENCTVNYFMPCCQRLINAILPVDIMKIDSSDTSAQYKYHNIGFYQSTLYTMISCAIAFVFMSTIMLIAVCRIRMRNAWYPRSSGSNSRYRFWQLFPPDNRRTNLANVESRVVASSVHSCPEHLNQGQGIDPLENFVLLTYDNNTGFEVAEYGPKPPPYTETNIGIPPPPYSSTISLACEAPDSSADASAINVPESESTEQQTVESISLNREQQ